MPARTIKVPDIGEGITEVELVAWRVQAGDDVAEDQILADVMTDKATVEIPSPVAGRVLALGGEVGAPIAVGAELIRIDVGAGRKAEAGGDQAGQASQERQADEPRSEDIAPDALIDGVSASERVQAQEAAGLPPASAPATAPPAAPIAERAAAEPAVTPGPVASSPPAPAAASAPERRPPGPDAGRDRPIASPAVRRRAWELGIDLRKVTPTGTAGRIMHADLDAYVAMHGLRPPQPSAALPSPAADETQAVPIRGLRRRIAQKMQESKRRIPHFTYVEEIDVTELLDLRERLNAGAAGGARLTLLPLLIRAIVIAVRRYPQLNARFDDDGGVVTRHRAVHVGIATQTDSGLMVPVLRYAETLDLWETAARIERLAAAARNGRATRDELTGSTITITSLGAQGGIVSTPVINHPEVAIVGVNRIVERPAFRAGALVARKTMNLSSSFDHRVIDGGDAAGFVQEMRRMLETPALLFVESH